MMERLVKLFFINSLALELPNVGLKMTEANDLLERGGTMYALLMYSNNII